MDATLGATADGHHFSWRYLPFFLALMLDLAGFGGGLWPWVFSVIEARYTKRETLLHDTDHRALLAACREIMANRSSYTADPHVYGNGGEYIDVTDKQRPEAVRRLRPVCIFALKNMVVIELHSGFDHYGVRAYAPEVLEKNQERSIKLLDGLWYWSE